jgi:predicted phage baseplate assembly protein
LLGAVPGVQAVFNPRPGEGGADGETLERFGRRAPKSVRHRGRAIGSPDYETMAYEASPAVGKARGVPTRNPGGRPLPGWVTVLIIPLSKEPRPWPSFGLREHVRRYLEERAPAELAAGQRIYVTGPDYLPVDVEATLAPVDPAEAGGAGQLAREALEAFLHPIHGGPGRRGFDLGRDLFLSDIAAVLERVPVIDYVEDLALYVNGSRQDQRVAIADDRVVVAGELRLRVTAAEV